MCRNGAVEEEILWQYLRTSAQGLSQALEELASVLGEGGGRAEAVAALEEAGGPEAETTSFAPHHHHTGHEG